MRQEVIEATLEETKNIASITDATIVERKFIVSGIEPKISVVQPHVKMVDVSLAYELADLQSDASNFIGFASLFLGTSISAAIGLILSASSSPVNSTELAIQSSIFVLTLIVTIIFGLFARKALRKASTTREELESKMVEIMPRASK